ncbi:Rieske (2Fe-2S) protein [Nitrospirillum viridazoti]|uniref:Rieske (2Fe-2S) protein n=1 Tax=Nitrospirillum viridazoti TaxID=3144925 RepID=UPI000681C132|nr:Rieske 2Fe-2S domain-containing protein [Nitrospirillum amazonense]
MIEEQAPATLPNAWQLRPQAPAIGTAIGRLDAVAEDGSKEFVFGVGLNAFRMFVVRREGRCFGYLNLCPHYSLPLNVRADEFLSRDGARIMCRRHLAVFTIDDGLCIDGACTGSKLEAVPVSVDQAGMLVIG